jgi:XTP/dITP diphosphohydrolase
LKLLLATNNKHKLIEIKSKIDNSFIELLSLNDVTDEEIDIEETSDTLNGNALIKARTIYDKFKIMTIADDTGLEVLSLNGEPGVKSARYSGDHCNDQKNREKLLINLKDKTNRDAQFRTVICLIDENTEVFIEGICKGRISEIEKGENGFGYDKIFIPEGYQETFAELNLEIKNKISHRAKAIDSLVEYLKENYS